MLRVVVPLFPDPLKGGSGTTLNNCSQNREQPGTTLKPVAKNRCPGHYLNTYCTVHDLYNGQQFHRARVTYQDDRRDIGNREARQLRQAAIRRPGETQEDSRMSDSANSEGQKDGLPLTPRPESPLPKTANNPFSMPASSPESGAGQHDNGPDNAEK